MADQSQKFQAQLERLEQRLVDKELKLLDGIQQGKSQLIGCRNCQSKLNRTYLTVPYCPVCKKLLATNKQAEDVHKTDQQCEELRQTLRGMAGHRPLGGQTTQPEPASAEVT